MSGDEGLGSISVRPSRRLCSVAVVRRLSVRPTRRPSRRRRPSSVRPSHRVRPVATVIVLCGSVRPLVRPAVVVRRLM